MDSMPSIGTVAEYWNRRPCNIRHSRKDAMIEAGFDHLEAGSDCPIAFTYTRKEINDLLEPADSKVISIEQDHIFPYVIEKYLRCEYEILPWLFAMPLYMFRALERRFGSHALIVAKLA